MRLTSYSDYLTGFCEPVLPPYRCHTGLEECLAQSLLHPLPKICLSIFLPCQFLPFHLSPIFSGTNWMWHKPWLRGSLVIWGIVSRCDVTLTVDCVRSPSIGCLVHTWLLSREIWMKLPSVHTSLFFFVTVGHGWGVGRRRQTPGTSATPTTQDLSLIHIWRCRRWP